MNKIRNSKFFSDLMAYRPAQVKEVVGTKRLSLWGHRYRLRKVLRKFYLGEELNDWIRRDGAWTRS